MNPSLRIARAPYTHGAAIPTWLPALAIAASCAAPRPAVERALDVAASPASAAVVNPSAAVADRLPVDPLVTSGRLDNGLRFFVRPNMKPENRASLLLVVNAGSVLETDEQRGMAHFIEHMAFNGTKKFKKQEIVDYLEKAGMKFGQDTNAFTGFDETVYMLEVPTDDAATFDHAFLILEQFAAEVSFDPAEVDKERGVVIEEWRLGRGAGMRVFDKQFPVIFKGSRYADRLPIGLLPILQKATPEDLRRFYRDYYRPDLMAVVAVGDFAPGAAEALIRKNFGGLKNPADEKPRTLFPVPDHAETLIATATDKELPQASVGVVYKFPHRATASRADYRRMVVERLYHHMLNARLRELTQKPDPPFFFGASMTQPFVRTRDVFAQFAGVKQDGIERGLGALLREVERVDRHGFAAGELDRAKTETLRGMQNAVKEKDKVESAQHSMEIMRYFLTDEMMPGIEGEKTLQDQIVPAVTLEELNGLARGWITSQNRVLMVSAPASATLPGTDTLLGLFAAIGKEAIPPYEDKVRSGPLVTVTAPPGSVVGERTIAELGVTEWLLGNGMRIVLKPTDFKNDQIVFSAWSPGGHSLVAEGDFASAEEAAALVDAGGAGDFGPIELQKALSGKLAGETPFIGELEEGFSGSAAPQDLETAFALLYLALTGPRTDDDVFASWTAQEREGIEHRKADPETSFADEFQTLYYRNHPRRRPPSLTELERVKLDRALAVFKRRFKDFSDATFVFVGNFTLDGIKPLLCKYLGGLPGKATGKPPKWRAHEQWKDIGVRAAPGVNRFEVRRGVEPKSLVHLSFTGDEMWSRERDYELDALADALTIRLREVVREELSGSYGVSVGGNLSRRPRQEYRVDISFGCAPENVDKLLKAVWDEIAAVKTSGFADAVLTKVKTTQVKGYEVDLKRNGFWLGALANAYRFERDPKEILTYGALIDGLSSDKLRDTARRVFNDKRYVLGVLKPEK